MIFHLSAPLGKSINDHISKEKFSLNYLSIDDATHMLSAIVKGTLMVKVCIQDGSSPVPGLGATWHEMGGAYYVDSFF